MKVFGRSSISEFLGDSIVYRNLVPVDKRIKGLGHIHEEVGLEIGRIPRKSEPDYARAIVHMLTQARSLDEPNISIEQLVFIGDTQLNDGRAYANICQAGGWLGNAFIGSETSDPSKIEHATTETGYPLFLSTRWGSLGDFQKYLAQQSFPVDEKTAVIIDLDKTALGARGRNAHVIDQARVQAVHDTVANLLGNTFNQNAFRLAYDQINQVEFHPFTTDNQDYLAYICLIVGSGLFDLGTVIDDVREGHLTTFEQFITQVNDQHNSLETELADVHDEIFANVRAGDPTPFKPFRRKEYLTTVARMGQMDDNVSVDQLLENEILITQEVRALSLEWLDQGALLFGLSDKPDEASIPTAEQVTLGYAPIHQVKTHSVGAIS